MVYYVGRRDFMNRKKMDRILNQIAKSHQTTPENVRKEMEFALEEAQKSTEKHRSRHTSQMGSNSAKRG